MPWVKGQSGNPRGAPKRGETMRRALEAALVGEKQAVAKAIVTLAKNGNIEAAKLIFDRVDGKVVEHIQSDSQTHVTYSVEYADSPNPDPPG